MIRKADRDLKNTWAARFAALPTPARLALRLALLDLRADGRLLESGRRVRGPSGALDIGLRERRSL